MVLCHLLRSSDLTFGFEAQRPQNRKSKLLRHVKVDSIFISSITELSASHDDLNRFAEPSRHGRFTRDVSPHIFDRSADGDGDETCL